MDERNELFSTLSYISIIGISVMSFLVSMVVFHHMRTNLLLSVILSIIFSTIITTARVFTEK